MSHSRRYKNHGKIAYSLYNNSGDIRQSTILHTKPYMCQYNKLGSLLNNLNYNLQVRFLSLSV